MSRTIINMDKDWRFNLGDINLEEAKSHSDSYISCKSGNTVGPGGKHWNDTDWRAVDLPHDYFSESDFSHENLISHGYRTRNNAWYRKSFTLDPSLEGKELILCFEGTAVNAEFYFNGSLMERSFSAYTETVFNITDRVYFDGRPNVLAVYINGLATEGWWYEGAGIYRHVKLYALDKLHIAHNGVFGKPVLKKGCKNSWNVEVEVTLENSNYTPETASVRATVLDGDTIISQNTSQIICDYAEKTVMSQRLSVSKPTRWDIDNPKLYTLKVEVLKGEKVIDVVNENIGFRTISIDADKGFFLNGRHLIIKGTCNHQDHAGVGVAVPDSVQYYRIKKLKEMGSNAYRCSHNLPNKEILDACDKLGLIVMDENRRFESRKEVLEYLDIMVRRDRNHPSIVFWSLFNEEPLQNTDEGLKIFKRMRSVVEKLDDTRIITGAMNGSADGAGTAMDAVGINYNLHHIENMRAKYPHLPLIGAENNSAVTTRGCYKSDYDKNILANYDEEVVPWGNSIRETWDFVRKHEYFAGIFVWTGFDYRGEPTPFRWPSVSSQFGIMDTCGFPKDAFYFHKACFTDKPMVHLLPHWNHNDGETVRVMAISNCEEVELFLNGKSLGKKMSDICDNIPEWNVLYEKGRITAKAYKNGKCVAKDEQRTAGKPYAVKICADTNVIKDNGTDVAVLNVCVVDKKGIIVPNADNLIKFTVSGDGIVKGVGNGDPNSHESDILPQRKLFAGWCQALIQANLNAKNVSFKAEADGLLADQITFEIVHTEPCIYPNPVVSSILDGFTMSSVTESKPNPLIELADNDMNSFIPVTFDGAKYQADFTKGWRIYRVTPTVYKTASYTVGFASTKFSYAEIYVNGELVNTCDKLHTGTSYKTEKFVLKAGGKADIRILMNAQGRDFKSGAGIVGIVELFEEK